MGSTSVRGEAVHLLDGARGVVLTDGGEISAVPEINLRMDRLVARLTSAEPARSLTPADFLGMGEGISPRSVKFYDWSSLPVKLGRG